MNIDHVERLVALIGQTTDREVRTPLIKLLWIAVENAGTINVNPCNRHKPCEMSADGYCARCHSAMY